jgi:hypothetical protein
VKKTGPALEAMTRRLLDTPAEFLAEPRSGDAGMVSVPALVNDVLRMHGHRVAAHWLDSLGGMDAGARRNRLAVAMIVAWLVADEWLLSQGLDRAELCSLFASTTVALAEATPAHRFVTDAGPGEELVRVVLAHFGYRPAGETPEQAGDRLTAVSGAARRKLLAASRESEKRAREVRDALARKAAEEAADKWTRE